MQQAAQGEEFREDLRPPHDARRAGAGNAAARRVLSADELAPLTRLSAVRSLASIAQTVGLIGVALAFGVALWPSPWVLVSVVVIGVQQHALFVLAHEAAHYRLFASREANDGVGRLLGMAGGVSMCTYRVIHRLHHNHLYGAEDPDTAIHGGYPRGVGYLWKKLAQDLAGLNAWKTFAYFFGAPALNVQTHRAARPLDDTSPQLRASARRDRWGVAAFHVGAPLAAFALGGGQGLALYAVLWLLPLVTVLQPILRLRAICEHGAVADLASPLTAARTNRTSGSAGNAIGRALLFPHHVNHHLEHHLYPAVPHYRLPALHCLLEAKGALADAEVRDFAETLALVFAPRCARAHPPPQGASA
jgi:fatty acid desaturase